MKKHLKDYLIPHEGNGYAPHSLQKAAVVGMMGMIILSFTLANIQSLIWISSQWMVSTILPAVIVELTNEERVEDALGILRRSALLDRAAQLKAQDMARNGYFAHYSPTGVTPWHWFGEVSYNFVHAGENLAIHFTDSGDVIQAWMDSPTHRENIMNGNYTEIGVGTAEGTYEGFSTVYVVQLFGTPAQPPAQPPAEVAVNETVEVPVVPPQVAVAGVTSSATTLEPEATTTVLAEAVVISESVEIIEAKPVAVVVEEESATSTPATEIANMEVTNQGVALYSDFISTSTGAIPATIESNTPHTVSTVPYFLRLATQPHAVLQIVYTVIALFVCCVLLLSILIEVRRQQPVQIAY